MGNNTARWLFDPITHLWIGSTLDSDEGDHLLDPARQARMAAAAKAVPGCHVQLTLRRRFPGKLVVHTEGDEDSGTYWLVDMAKGPEPRLGTEYPDIGKADVGAVRMVAWKAPDGLELRGC